MTLHQKSIALQTARWYVLAESLCLPRRGEVCADHQIQAKGLLKRLEARGLTLAPLRVDPLPPGHTKHDDWWCECGLRLTEEGAHEPDQPPDRSR